MTPHSTSEEVASKITEIENGHRKFIGIQDARAIASWYMSPDEHAALRLFAQGNNIEVGALIHDVQDLCVSFINTPHDDGQGYFLLYLLAYAAMRGGMASFIDGRE